MSYVIKLYWYFQEIGGKLDNYNANLVNILPTIASLVMMSYHTDPSRNNGETLGD